MKTGWWPALQEVVDAADAATDKLDHGSDAYYRLTKAITKFRLEAANIVEHQDSVTITYVIH